MAFKKRILEAYLSEPNFSYKIFDEKVNVYDKFKKTDIEVTFAVRRKHDTINLASVSVELNDMFKDIVEKRIQKYNGGDKISFMLFNDTTEVPIYVPIRKIEDFKISQIMHHIQQAAQSKKGFLLEGEHKLVISIVKKITGSGKAPVKLENISKCKKSVVVINNSDNLCGLRAFCVAKYHLDNINNLRQGWERIRKDRHDMQTNLALELSRYLNIEIVTIDDWKKIQNHYNEYQINVIDARSRSLIFRGNDNKKRLYIEYLDNHY